MMSKLISYHSDRNTSSSLPRAPTDFRRPFEFNWSSLSGFGYDAVSDDYKVLRILRPDDPFLSGSNTSKATVYSLKTNSWRRLQDISCHYQLNAAWGMFMGGALHWIRVKIMGSELCPSIIAFDLGSENYREFPLPHKNGKEMSLVTFAESLCILEFCLDIHVNVWVMNDYGVGNSRCKLFSVEQPKVSTSCMPLIQRVRRMFLYMWTPRRCCGITSKGMKLRLSRLLMHQMSLTWKSSRRVLFHLTTNSVVMVSRCRINHKRKKNSSNSKRGTRGKQIIYPQGYGKILAGRDDMAARRMLNLPVFDSECFF
ncbi:hypothetical protein POM88_042727 [Heracleum sosnowskyi]|uniref:F-box associated beta-propeller type 1 domain-containing protein n=1 Tax=Heracleum sosnowskyi TaxID=360622 RepID=A0AAD8HIF4_9APIA|nr:hypothetical protein POM88_042727 [Heracleum sosnowskyi]